MKLLLLGNGAVGNVLLRLLENEKDIDEIVSADILFKKETKVGKVRKVYVDLKDTISISKVISENNPDLVVNVCVDDDFILPSQVLRKFKKSLARIVSSSAFCLVLTSNKDLSF
jgi:predicted dinucleotide-utilizing enzyme